MAKHNPDIVTTVALSHAEIFEILEATRGNSKENPTLFSAKLKLRKSVRTPKPVEAPHAPVH